MLFSTAASAHSLFETQAASRMSNFNGAWRGQGSKQSNLDPEKKCQLIAFDIQQTTTTIAVASGQIRCEDKTTPIQNISGTITAEGSITVWGIPIGRISGSLLEIQTSLGKGGSKKIQLRLNGNSLAMYFDRVENGTHETVTGQLFR